MSYKFYKSVDFLIAFNYYKAKDSGDLRYLLKLEDYEYLPDDFDVSILEPVMAEIDVEISEIGIKFNNKLKIRHELEKSIYVLKAELSYILNGLDILMYVRDKDVEKELVLMGYKIDESKPYEDELSKIQNRSMTIATKIQLKELDLKDMTPDNITDYDIQQSVQAVSDYKGRDIDLKKLTIKEWLIMEYSVIDSANKKPLKDGKRA